MQAKHLVAYVVAYVVASFVATTIIRFSVLYCDLLVTMLTTPYLPVQCNEMVENSNGTILDDFITSAWLLKSLYFTLWFLSISLMQGQQKTQM